MREKHTGFAQVSDIFGFRIVVRHAAPSATSRSACCTSCTSRCRAASRTTSRSPRPTATSRCTPRWSARWAPRWSSRSAPSADARGGRDGHRRALAVQDQATRADSRRRAAPGRDVAAVAARHPGRDARRGRVPRAREDRPVARCGLRVHAQEQDPGAAARRHAGGLCLRDPLRRRRPHGGRQGQRRAGGAAHRAAQRRRGRGRHRTRRAPQPGLAELRAHRPCALQDPPPPEDDGAGGVARTGREDAGAGAARRRAAAASRRATTPPPMRCGSS